MDLNHVAVFVDDIDRTTLGPALGGWGAPAIVIAGQPVTVGGRPTEHAGRTRRVRTASAPVFGVSVEDVAPDAPIQPVAGNAWHHVAFWCDDVPGTVAALEGEGYRREVVGRAADGSLSIFAYMVSPWAPRIELADAAMRAGSLEYFVRATSTAFESALSAPLVPFEVAAVVQDLAEFEALKRIWQTALGIDWEVADTAVTVVTPQGERELRTRSARSAGDPYVSIVAPDAASALLLAPVAPTAWHHVGFRSGDLPRDTAALQAAGFTLEFRSKDDDAGKPGFAMLVAPEGTRIKLAAG